MDRNFREGSHFRTAAGANDQLHMNLGVGRGNPNGGGAPGAGGAGGAPDPREEKRIADAMKQGGANQQQIDQALKNYRGGKGGAQPSGSLINAGLGYNGAKTYT
ncbi:hypothetical protein NLR42_26185, partial [Escherichia coli]|nr:hypothetical protein [Escherichia coli]